MSDGLEGEGFDFRPAEPGFGGFAGAFLEMGARGFDFRLAAGGITLLGDRK